MKKIVTIQILLLLSAVILGLLLKSDLASGARDFHKIFGMLSGLTGVVTTVMAFKRKQTRTIKILAGAALFLIVSAAFGGASLERTTNYDLSYGQMALSGFLALIVSGVLLYKVKKHSH